MLDATGAVLGVTPVTVDAVVDGQPWTLSFRRAGSKSRDKVITVTGDMTVSVLLEADGSGSGSGRRPGGRKPPDKVGPGPGSGSDKIDLMDDEGYSRDGDYSQRRYSRDGDYSQRRYSRDSYGGGSSYARRGTHYVRGHYSRDGAKDDMKRQLQEMLDNADDDTIRNAIQRCMDAVEG